MTRSLFVPSRLVVLCPVILMMFLLAGPGQAAVQSDASTPTSDAGATPEADTSSIFVIRPVDGADGDYFTLVAKPGSTHELTVVLGNADDEVLSLRTYANDAVPVANGGFSLAEEDVAPTGIATWIDYPAEIFEFAPGAGIERSFSVAIPDDVAPGQYIAGLALQTAEPLAVEGTSLFDQIIRKEVAVFIIIPGPETPEFTLGEPAYVAGDSVDRIDIPVVNSGNVLVKPQGELTLRDSSGETVLTAPIAMGSVYAGTTAPLSISLMTDLPEGDYAVQVTLTDDVTGAIATIDSRTVAIAAPDQATAQFAFTGAAMLMPHTTAPVYAEVTVEVTNQGAPVSNAEVLLDILMDGELVETFVLVPALALPQGATVVTQRYVPPAGFSAGLWSFSIRINVIDPSTGISTTVATLDAIPPIEVGG